MRGKNVYIRTFTLDDAEALVKLQQRNREFFESTSMAREDDFYTIEYQQNRIETFIKDHKEDRSYHFGIYLNETDQLIGVVTLFQVMRGSLQSAFIGYSMDEAHNGKGYTTEAVQLLVSYAFETVQLHRIEAGVMPQNIASIRVLEKAGFHKEGLAIKNVKINGKWEDHQVLAIINPEEE